MASPEISPAMNQVLLDFENVPQIDFSVFGGRPVTFTLLLGAKQEKLDAALVEKLTQHAAAVNFVRLTTSGRNALDFALAYYLGRAALADPTAYFHIISRDKGFDSLVEHLRSRHIRARRHDDFSTLTFSAPPRTQTPPPPRPQQPPPARATSAPDKPQPRPPKASPAPEKSEHPSSDLPLLEQALAYLQRKKSNRPKRVKALASDLRSHLGKDLSEDDIAHLIVDLVEEEHIDLSDKGDVTYLLDDKEPESEEPPAEEPAEGSPKGEPEQPQPPVDSENDPDDQRISE